MPNPAGLYVEADRQLTKDSPKSNLRQVMTEKPIPESDRVPDVFELSRRVNEPFEKREARNMIPPSRPRMELEEGCPNFGGGNQTRVIPEERGPDWTTDQLLDSLVEPEPMPTKNELPFMWPRAMERFAKLAQARDEFGAKKYGTRLQPFNGRNPTTDALQELLDAFVYFEQILFEETYKQAIIDAAIDLVETLGNSVKHPKFLKLVETVDALRLASSKVDKA